MSFTRIFISFFDVLRREFFLTNFSRLNSEFTLSTNFDGKLLRIYFILKMIHHRDKFVTCYISDKIIIVFSYTKFLAVSIGLYGLTVKKRSVREDILR